MHWAINRVLIPVLLAASPVTHGPLDLRTSGLQMSPSARPLVLPFAVTVEAAVPGGDGAAFWLGEAAAILLADELDAQGVAALSRADRVEAFGKLQLPFVATLTRATMLRVAELVGATDLVVGEVKLGARMKVTARVIAVDAAHQRPEIVEEGPGTEMYAIFERVAARLGPGVAGPPTAANHRTHLPLGAFEQYVKGLVAPTPSAQERFLEQARQQAPNDDRVLLALWELHASQDAHEKALSFAQMVSRQAPLDRQARLSAALSMIELSRFNDAYDLLQAMHGEQPSPVLSNALGVIQLRRGSTPQTGVPTYFFTRAADGEPDNADYLFNLGYAYARSRDTDAALYWLREVVGLSPADGDAHLVMSQMLAAAGKKVEAQRELDLAKQLGTTQDTDALTLSDKVPAGLERLEGRLDLQSPLRVGAAIANPKLREQQELAAFHVDRGRRLFEQEDDRAAINELRRAIYLKPYDDEPHLLLGRIYQRRGQLREAIEEFRIAVWCRDSSPARVRLGEALLDSGDRVAARAEAQRALAMTPDSADARALLARIGGTRLP
jgi:tetratricopeptide (TPR) repeat protein